MTVIEEIQPLQMSNGQFVSFSWALKSALAALDQDYDYDFINGITGGAFSIQSSEFEDCKAWWTTGNQTGLLAFVAKVFGFKAKSLPEGFRYPQHIEAIEDPWEFFDQQLKEPVLDSLGQGIPVLAQGMFDGFRAGQWSVLAGFESGLPVGQGAWGDGYEASQTPPWRVVLLSKPDPAADPKDVVKQALLNAVELAKSKAPSEPGWTTGQESWKAVLDGLNSEFYCKACGPESGSCLHWTASYVAGARVSAVHFLDMSTEILEMSSESISKAMASYAAVVEALRPYTVPEAAFKALETDREKLIQDFTTAMEMDLQAAESLEEMTKQWFS